MSLYHPFERWGLVGVQVRDFPRSGVCDGYFNHKTGKGWVAGHRGHYDDTLATLRMKKNIVCILLHETSSGFSPPSARPRSAAWDAGRSLSGVDRTPYTLSSSTWPMGLIGTCINLNKKELKVPSYPNPNQRLRELRL